MDLTEEQKQKILNQYVKKRIREKKYYHNICKNDEEYQKKNRARAKKHYDEKSKITKKEMYEKNSEFLKARQLYYYYKKKDDFVTLKLKHPDKVEILIQNGIKLD